MACGAAQTAQTTSPAAPARKKVQLTVIPAESDAFPRAAQALSSSLAGVRLRGVDETHVSKVSLEVVQLSIECVDASDACYQAIGRSMAANRLLFARIEAEPRDARRKPKVTVTLYDVDARTARKTAERVFSSEDDAVAAAADLVAEATR
jgi:hypothetical protein